MSKTKTWLDQFPDSNVKLDTLLPNESWTPLFDQILSECKKEIKALEEMLQATIKDSVVFPYPDHVFNAFKLTDLSDIKVVIFGQDPYFKAECVDKSYIPQAMGLSFSVQDKIKIPPSLVNINNNLLKFNHINAKPKSGNLTSWAQQGCLLLNSSLTVTNGLPNSHEKYWKKITDLIIKYISNNTTNTVFFLWGNPSLKKLSLIDQTKHKVSISSHPSPLSVKNKLGKYLSFEDTDHFGIANEYLTANGKDKINW
jgi:uracil-DNA glycosylase